MRPHASTTKFALTLSLLSSLILHWIGMTESNVCLDPPSIAKSASSITITSVHGEAIDDTDFDIWNGSCGTLNYTLKSDANWLKLGADPDEPSAYEISGQTDINHDTINVGIDYALLACGENQASITITDPLASNTPQTITVTVTVEQSLSILKDGLPVTDKAPPVDFVAGETGDYYRQAANLSAASIDDKDEWREWNGTSWGAWTEITDNTHPAPAWTYDPSVALSGAGMIAVTCTWTDDASPSGTQDTSVEDKAYIIVEGPPTSSTSIELHWKDVSGETGYRLYRSTNGVDYSLLVDLPANTTSYIDTGLDPETTYYYRVTPYDGQGDMTTWNITAETNKYEFALYATDATLVMSVDSAGNFHLYPDTIAEQQQTFDSSDSEKFEIRAPNGDILLQRVLDDSMDVLRIRGTAYLNDPAPSNEHFFHVEDMYGTTVMSVDATGSLYFLGEDPDWAPQISVVEEEVTDSQVVLTCTNKILRPGAISEIKRDAGTIESYWNVNGDYTDDDVSLQEYSTYSYQGFWCGNAGNAINVTTRVSAPSGFDAIALSTTAIGLTWTDNSACETGYLLEYSTDSWQSQDDITLDPNTESYVHTQLQSGVTYNYRLKALSSNPDCYSTVVEDGIAPGALCTLSTEAQSDATVELEWTNPGLIGYWIERDDGAGFTLLEQGPFGGYSYMDESADEDTNYIYRLADTNGVISNSVNLLTPLRAPSGLAIHPIQAATVDLSWEDNSSCEDGYRIWRKRQGDPTFAVVDDVDEDVVTMREIDLPHTGDETYYYKVQAISAGNESLLTDDVDVTVPTCLPNPPLPTSLNPEEDAEGISPDDCLSWEDGTDWGAVDELEFMDSAGSLGREFLFALPDRANSGGVNTPQIDVVLTARQECQASVWFPYDMEGQPVSTLTLTADEPASVTLVEEGEASLDGVTIHVLASEDISCVVVRREAFNSDASLILPTTSLGSDYVICAANVAITAVADFTAIRLIYDDDTKEPPDEDPPLILHRGETLSRTSIGSLDDCAYVHATKPVAVITGEYGLIDPECQGCGAYDAYFEMALPTELSGTEFVIPKLPYHRTETPMDPLVEMIILEDATQINGAGPIYYAGERVQWLQAGFVVSTNKPVILNQYLSNRDDNMGDPAMAILPTSSQYTNSNIFTTQMEIDSSPQFSEHWLTVVAHAEDVSADSVEISFDMDGEGTKEVYTAGDLNVTWESASALWKYANIKVFSTDESDIINAVRAAQNPPMAGEANPCRSFVVTTTSQGHMIYLSGYNTFDSYFYTGNLSQSVAPKYDCYAPRCSISSFGEFLDVVAMDNRLSEDRNQNGLMDAGEDGNADGRLNGDTGISSIVISDGADMAYLAEDASGVPLTVEPGHGVIAFQIVQRPDYQGSDAPHGTLRITDCSGNIRSVNFDFDIQTTYDVYLCDQTDEGDLVYNDPSDKIFSDLASPVTPSLREYFDSEVIEWENEYSWKVVSKNLCGTKESAIYHFTAGEAPSPDRGDAPLCYEQSNPATHSIEKLSVRLGQYVDGEDEEDLARSAAADGDDAVGWFDDEDGIEFLAPWVYDRDGVTEICVHASGPIDAQNPAYLQGWADFDRDGVFESTEKLWTYAVEFSAETAASGETFILDIPLPAGVTTSSSSIVRFRIGETAISSPTGDATGAGGEVEDYEVMLYMAPLADYGDAPSSYQDGVAPASHDTLTSWHLGYGCDGDNYGSWSPLDGLNDDESGENDDDGVYCDSAWPCGQTINLSYALSRSGGYLNIWLDDDGDGEWDESERLVKNNVIVSSSETISVESGSNSIELVAPSIAGNSLETFMRVRYTRDSLENVDPLDDIQGHCDTGEVEDYAITLYDMVDRGDAPESYIDGIAETAAHGYGEDYVLGRNFDAEFDDASSPDARGDDCDFTDDEDGVIFMTPLIAGEQAEIAILITNDAYSGNGSLGLWIDYDQDGVWDNGVSSVEAISVPAKGNWRRINAVDSERSWYKFAITVDANALAGKTFARFRWAGASVSSPHGEMASGEVEDYWVVVEESTGKDPAPFDLEAVYVPEAGATPRHVDLKWHGLEPGENLIVDGGFEEAVALSTWDAEGTLWDPPIADSAAGWGSGVIHSGQHSLVLASDGDYAEQRGIKVRTGTGTVDVRLRFYVYNSDSSGNSIDKLKVYLAPDSEAYGEEDVLPLLDADGVPCGLRSFSAPYPAIGVFTPVFITVQLDEGETYKLRFTADMSPAERLTVFYVDDVSMEEVGSAYSGSSEFNIYCGRTPQDLWTATPFSTGLLSVSSDAYAYTHEDTMLEDSGDVFYRIARLSGGEDSEFSGAVVTYISTEDPAAPNGLTIWQGDDKYVLNWRASKAADYLASVVGAKDTSGYSIISTTLQSTQFSSAPIVPNEPEFIVVHGTSSGAEASAIIANTEAQTGRDFDFDSLLGGGSIYYGPASEAEPFIEDALMTEPNQLAASDAYALLGPGGSGGWLPTEQTPESNGYVIVFRTPLGYDSNPDASLSDMVFDMDRLREIQLGVDVDVTTGTPNYEIWAFKGAIYGHENWNSAPDGWVQMRTDLEYDGSEREPWRGEDGSGLFAKFISANFRDYLTNDQLDEDTHMLTWAVRIPGGSDAVNHPEINSIRCRKYFLAYAEDLGWSNPDGEAHSSDNDRMKVTSFIASVSPPAALPTPAYVEFELKTGLYTGGEDLDGSLTLLTSPMDGTSLYSIVCSWESGSPPTQKTLEFDYGAASISYIDELGTNGAVDFETQLLQGNVSTTICYWDGDTVYENTSGTMDCDTDDDGLPDRIEIMTAVNTDPYDRDSDEDGLLDGEEYLRLDMGLNTDLRMNPLSMDSDEDGISDPFEAGLTCSNFDQRCSKPSGPVSKTIHHSYASGDPDPGYWTGFAPADAVSIVGTDNSETAAQDGDYTDNDTGLKLTIDEPQT